MMVMNNAHDLTRNHNVPVDHGVTLEPFLHQVLIFLIKHLIDSKFIVKYFFRDVHIPVLKYDLLPGFWSCHNDVLE